MWMYYNSIQYTPLLITKMERYIRPKKRPRSPMRNSTDRLQNNKFEIKNLPVKVGGFLCFTLSFLNPSAANCFHYSYKNYSTDKCDDETV